MDKVQYGLQSTTHEADPLIEELRRRRWTMYRWGPEDHHPTFIAWVYDFGTCADVILLRDEDDATGYRAPTLCGVSMWDPEQVLYQYHGNAARTLRVMFALAEPGTQGAPAYMDKPLDGCCLPRGLSSTLAVRPLSQVSRSAWGVRLPQ